MQEDRDVVLVCLKVLLPFKLEDIEAREGVTLNASVPKIESKVDKIEWNILHKRSGKVVRPPVLYMKEYGSDIEEGALSTVHKNYYAQLCKLDEDETKNIKMAGWQI